MINPRFWLYRVEYDIHSEWYGEYWQVWKCVFIFNIQIKANIVQQKMDYDECAVWFLNHRKENRNPFALYADWRTIRKSMFNKLMGIR